MFAFLSMNAADAIAQSRGLEHYVTAGPFGEFLADALVQWVVGCRRHGGGTRHVVVPHRWGFGIPGMSKFLHFHIILAFPNTHDPTSTFRQMDNMAAVKKEVDLMMDLNVTHSQQRLRPTSRFHPSGTDARIYRSS